ncbi:succinyl-diaminopimelate desuccinylase [Sphaerisporangium rubeum]|uniref:Succinyl-diaminopimelate desuccinylase n=1 Tax=Sphaerisporangium rubeum TaxID=321317 RepID=A0A7X0IEE2_9ACTN|nr:M20/M25/M40 family metallo-hydrolase [Sphaerisporangium rubeum]MBB6473714.1 succinyl-diaminopimelate desuccinylase [Sphaerisporangium rubeum]
MSGEPEIAAALHMADEDHDAVVALTRELVRIPSRGGVDSYEPVLEHTMAWLAAHGLRPRKLTGAGPQGTTVAVVCEVSGVHTGPRYVLDACLDTAPYGDEAAWTYPPSSGEITDGWLHGRGSADSKVGAAIFAHVLARLNEDRRALHGGVLLLLDVDEHTGGFGGAKAYFEGPAALGQVDGVMIGYPGIEHVVVGGRGVLRASVHVHGVAGHSGGSKVTPSAIAKAADLVTVLGRAELPGSGGPEFPPAAKLTVTAINGGEGFSLTPDLCTLNVDIRLTPAMDDRAAEDLLRGCVATVDTAWPGTRPSSLEITTRWPPYRLGEDSQVGRALLGAAAKAGLAPEAKVAGPSNIGNYLAGLGVEATAGFGVDYVGLHATDERIRLGSIPPVQATYHHALLTLLKPRGNHH